MVPEVVPALRGRTVMVTRPPQQAEKLCAMISAAGGRPIRAPAMTILPPLDELPAQQALNARGKFDAVIFVSRNAVLFAEGLSPGFIAGLAETPVYAVGMGTARELESRGLRVEAPQGDRSGSEALLDLAGLRADRARNRSFLIVRGIGGRVHIGRELERRGARVSYAEVYRRAAPEPDPDGLQRMWREARPDVIVITSIQGLEQLVSMTDPEWRNALLDTALVTISGRVARRAASLGWRASVRIAPAASDEGLMDAIAQTLAARA